VGDDPVALRSRWRTRVRLRGTETRAHVPSALRCFPAPPVNTRPSVPSIAAHMAATLSESDTRRRRRRACALVPSSVAVMMRRGPGSSESRASRVPLQASSTSSTENRTALDQMSTQGRHFPNGCHHESSMGVNPWWYRRNAEGHSGQRGPAPSGVTTEGSPGVCQQLAGRRLATVAEPMETEAPDVPTPTPFLRHGVGAAFGGMSA